MTSEERASKAEKIILYNPFLILITSVRGMFDIWMVDFLLLSVLLVRKKQYSSAGVSLGLSLLIKPISLIFVPIFLVYIWNRNGDLAKVGRFLACSALVSIVVCLPFFVTAPRGFIYQTVWFQVQRPGSGYTLPGLLCMLGHSPLALVSSAGVSALFDIVLVAAILCVCLYFRVKRTVEENSFVASLFFIMLLFTLFSKVVNPQYFVTPLVLAIILLFAYRQFEPLQRNIVKQYYKWLVIPFVGATVIYDGIYSGLVPTDVSNKLVGKTTGQLELQIINNLPFSSNSYQLILGIMYGLLVAPAMILAGFICYRYIMHIKSVVGDSISGYLSRMASPTRKKALLRGFYGLVICTLFVAPTSAGLQTYMDIAHAQATQKADIAPLGDKTVGVFYYYWWHNSTYDPNTRSDNWLAARLTPEEGYYDLNPAYMKEDIRLMKKAGIDFAVVSVSNIFPDRYQTFVQLCEEQGFHFVPMVEVADFLIDQPSPGYGVVSLDEKTKESVIDKIQMVLGESDSPCYLRKDGKPVLFIHSTPYFSNDSGSAYNESFWSDVRAQVEKEFGKIFWVIDLNWPQDTTLPSGFDSSFYLPSFAWLSASDSTTRLQDWTQSMENASWLPNRPHIATVTPNYERSEKDARNRTTPIASEFKSTYDQTWGVALKGHFDMTLIFAWNEYFGGACIEPTREIGTELLKQTTVWAHMFKSGPS
jgi:hypothetical protein